MFAKRGGRESSSGPSPEPRLHELEVGETRQAPAAAECQADDQLSASSGQQPPRADGDCDEREDPDHRLVETRRAGVDHRRVEVRIGRALHRSSVATRRRARPRKLDPPAWLVSPRPCRWSPCLRPPPRRSRSPRASSSQTSPIFGTRVQPRLLARLRLPDWDGADRVQAAQCRPARRRDRRRLRGRADDRAGPALSEGAGRDRAGTAATTRVGCCPRASTSRGSTSGAVTDDHAAEPDQDRRDAAAAPGRQRCAARHLARRRRARAIALRLPLPAQRAPPRPAVRQRQASCPDALPAHRGDDRLVRGVWAGGAVRRGFTSSSCSPSIRPGIARRARRRPRWSCVSSPSAATGSPSPPQRRSPSGSPLMRERLRWTLGRRSGLPAPGHVAAPRPAEKGRLTLTVSANGHMARAAVFVRQPLRGPSSPASPARSAAPGSRSRSSRRDATSGSPPRRRAAGAACSASTSRRTVAPDAARSVP